MRYANNIKEIRKKYKCTQEKFAVRLGVSQSAVSHWESGINQPSDKLCVKLAKMADKKGLRLKVL